MKIFPFKGVRPKNQLAGHLITRPYKEYGHEELKSELAFNPFSFLQILNPGYRYHQNLKGESRFKLVHNRYSEFKERNFLEPDKKDCLYIYRKTTSTHSYLGIIANVSIDDYINDTIKKHENTIDSRVQLFTEYLHTVGYNAEPVLMTYPDQDGINQLIDHIVQKASDQDFYTSDMMRHQLWSIADPQTIEQIKMAFNQVSHIYIADGHHRSASSTLLAQEYGDQNSSYNQFMVFLLPQSQLQIGMYSRFIRGLNGHTPESLLIALDDSFQIEEYGLHFIEPTEQNQFIMYLDGRFFLLKLRDSEIDTTSELSVLNTQILYEQILNPTLGITNLRTDDRLNYSDGLSDLLVMQQLVDQGKYDIGFSMLPINMCQIMDIADAQLIMPPKSTFIAPKLYSGLVIYEFDN